MVKMNFHNQIGLCILLLHALAVSVDGYRHFDNQELFNIFKLMSEEGRAYLDKLKQEGAPHVNQNHSTQFLVAVLLSEEKVRASQGWRNLRDHIDVDNELRMYANERLNDCNLQLKKKPLHGEVICLYWKNGLNAMVDQFKQNNPGEVPIVLLFSHYIPCAYVNGFPYSCSEELGEQALANMDKYEMIVGFEEFFSRTDQEKAMAFMRHGNIQVFFLQPDILDSMYYVPPRPTSQGGMFQQQFTECLIEADIQGGCQYIVPGACSHVCLNETIFTRFVDGLSYHCTKKEEFKYMSGNLTQYKRGVFLRCAETYIKENTESSCDSCKYPLLIQDWLRFCAMQSLGSAGYIGAMTADTRKLVEPRPDQPWPNLYPQEPPMCMFPRAFCNNAVNCTVLVTDTEFTSSSKHKLKRLIKQNKQNYWESKKQERNSKYINEESHIDQI